MLNIIIGIMWYGCLFKSPAPTCLDWIMAQSSHEYHLFIRKRGNIGDMAQYIGDIKKEQKVENIGEIKQEEAIENIGDIKKEQTVENIGEIKQEEAIENIGDRTKGNAIKYSTYETR
eukprot:771468_1